MSSGEPPQQVRRLVEILRRVAGRRVGHQGRQLVRQRALSFVHPLGVRHYLPNVSEYPAESAFDPFERFVADGRVELQMHPRLRCARRCCDDVGTELFEDSIGRSVSRKDRMYEHPRGHFDASEQGEHCFDEQRHIVGDDLHGCTQRVVAADGDARGVRPADPAEFDMSRRRRNRIGYGITETTVDFCKRRHLRRRSADRALARRITVHHSRFGHACASSPVPRKRPRAADGLEFEPIRGA